MSNIVLLKGRLYQFRGVQLRYSHHQSTPAAQDRLPF